MTRSEAIIKINYHIKNPNDLLCCLEKLGLIKFDEEKQIDSPSLIIRSQLIDLVNMPMQKADSIVNALYRAGYKIVNTN